MALGVLLMGVSNSYALALIGRVITDFGAASAMADRLLPSFSPSYLLAAGVALLGAVGLMLLPRGATPEHIARVGAAL